MKLVNERFQLGEMKTQLANIERLIEINERNWNSLKIRIKLDGIDEDYLEEAFAITEEYADLKAGLAAIDARIAKVAGSVEVVAAGSGRSSAAAIGALNFQ